jgi:hypothetical protein
LESGTPILRRIPVLGKLFESTTIDYSNTELIVLVTPNIVDSDKNEFKEKELPENSNAYRVMNMNVKDKVDELPSVTDMIKANNEHRITDADAPEETVVAILELPTEQMVNDAVPVDMTENVNRSMANAFNGDSQFSNGKLGSFNEPSTRNCCR